MNRQELEADLAKDGEVIVHKLEEWARTRGDRTFFYYGEEDRRLSFREFNGLANAIAHNLSSMGIQKGDRISLFLMNPLVTALAMFGMWKIGAVYCPINFNYHGRLLSYQINDTEPKLLIAEQCRVPALNDVEAEVPDVPVVLHQPVEGEHDFDPACEDAVLHDGFRPYSFRDLMEGDASNPGIAVDYMDTANIIYTSGTTGPAKGVVQAHRWIHNYIYYNLKFSHPDDVVHNDLPLYHVGGAFANVGRAAWGGCMVAVWDRFSPSEFWQRVEKAGATSAILLDVMMPWLLIPEETADDRRNTLKQVHMQPLPEYHHAFARRFGIDVVSVGYGQTEAGGGFVGLIDELGDEEGTPPELMKGHTREDAWRIAGGLGVPVVPGGSRIKKGFMGRPSLLLEAAVLDENDRELDPGQHGQLAFRPRLPFLMLEEYFNKPEATLEVFRNLWFHTGDGGYEDEDGSYYFVDRMGGFIRRRGENISSYQIEDIITGHPRVGVCAAFPVPAEQGEEDDIVVYVVSQGELSEGDLRAWIEAEMPRFMRPQHIRFVDALPQTPTYKVEKYKLKQRFLEEAGANVHPRG
jgi:crotonobetaine/carnitine-CoA ligase